MNGSTAVITRQPNQQNQKGFNYVSPQRGVQRVYGKETFQNGEKVLGNGEQFNAQYRTPDQDPQKLLSERKITQPSQPTQQALTLADFYADLFKMGDSLKAGELIRLKGIEFTLTTEQVKKLKEDFKKDKEKANELQSILGNGFNVNDIQSVLANKFEAVRAVTLKNQEEKEEAKRNLQVLDQQEIQLKQQMQAADEKIKTLEEQSKKDLQEIKESRIKNANALEKNIGILNKKKEVINKITNSSEKVELQNKLDALILNGNQLKIIALTIYEDPLTEIREYRKMVSSVTDFTNNCRELAKLIKEAQSQ